MTVANHGKHLLVHIIQNNFVTWLDFYLKVLLEFGIAANYAFLVGKVYWKAHVVWYTEFILLFLNTFNPLAVAGFIPFWQVLFNKFLVSWNKDKPYILSVSKESKPWIWCYLIWISHIENKHNIKKISLYT